MGPPGLIRPSDVPWNPVVSFVVNRSGIVGDSKVREVEVMSRASRIALAALFILGQQAMAQREESAAVLRELHDRHLVKNPGVANLLEAWSNRPPATR
jgi:hypothetical protein